MYDDRYPMSVECSADGRLRILSPAKINWTLAVRGKRTDGFHEIASLVSPVTLYDELEFTGHAGDEVQLSCNAAGIPTDEQNLVVRAALSLARQAHRSAGVRCRLTKRIPAGGGMGGGSSNAAATLLALNRYWGLQWTTARLSEVAAELGSDVPLFLRSGSVVMSGRGEQVEPVHLPWRGWVVLLLPGLSVATAAVYRAWRPAAQEPRPVVPSRAGNAIEWMNGTFNMLEAPAFEVCPTLGKLWDEATSLAARPVRVSGSGSTMFTAFDEREEALAFASSAEQRLGLQTEVVRPVGQV